MSLNPTPSCTCLARAGLSLSTTNLHLAGVKHKLLFPCFLCILLNISLHPFIIGLVFGAAVIFYLCGWWLLELVSTKDNMKRVRMVATGDRRCPVLWLVTMGFWNRRVQTKFISIKEDSREVVNLWPLEFGQFSKDLLQKYGTKMTVTAIVEVVGRRMKIMYTVNNMARKYLEVSDEVEVFTFHHFIDLRTAKISLTGTEDQPLSRKFSKRLPICVESSVIGHTHFFYIFHRIKKRKETLFNFLTSVQVEEENEAGDVEDLVEKVIKECRLKCSFSEGRGDSSIEMINLIINRLGAKFLTQEILFDPIQKILKSRLIRKFGKIFKNLGLKEIDLGERYPLIKKMSKPWHNERGLWAQVVICETGDKLSITVEANSLNIQSSHPHHTSSCSSEEEASPGLSAAQWIDQEIAQLAFTLDILQFELVLLLNIPPPGPPQIHPLRFWIGLCHLPLVDIQLAASGAKPAVTSLLNTFMPVVREATIKKLNQRLKTKWVYPNMKEFLVPIPAIK